jgi:hypothetical protein
MLETGGHAASQVGTSIRIPTSDEVGMLENLTGTRSIPAGEEKPVKRLP